MAEPPPSATTQVRRTSMNSDTQALTTSTVGSGTTRSNSSQVQPIESKRSVTWREAPDFAMNGSHTTAARSHDSSSSLSSVPAPLAICAPKTNVSIVYSSERPM